MSARKPFHREVTPGWWLRNPYFVRYMLRELSSLFVLGYVLIMLWALVALRAGPEAYNAFLAALQSKWLLAFHLAAFVMVGLHTITFLRMTPKTTRIEFRGKKVPDGPIVVLEYVVLAGVFAVVAIAFLVV